MITNDARCICEVKYRIVMEKAAFNKKKKLFTCKLEINLMKKTSKVLHVKHSFYRAENWTRRKSDPKYLGRFEMLCCRRMEYIIWTVRREKKKNCLEPMRAGISYIQ
jgi:hypothetical protein